jgi:hypothetical protein
MARTLLLYGETDTYKTSNCVEFSRWLRRRVSGTKFAGLPVGWIYGDSGIGPAQADIAAGYILPVNLAACKYPIAVIKQLSRGMWPGDLDVTTGRFTEDDGHGKSRLVMQDWSKPKVCGYVIEGLHENAKIFMGDAEDKGRAIGEPLQGTEWNKDTNSFNYKYIELGEKHVLRSRGTYYHAQTVTERYVNAFKSLPVPWCMFTSHQTLGKDDNDRPTFGPAIIGTANVDKITGWFECSFHVVSQIYQAEVVIGGTDEKPVKKMVDREGAILWFQKHADTTLRQYLWHSKLGVSTQQYTQILKRWPEGHFWLMLDDDTGEYTQSVASILEMVDPTPSVVSK